VAKDAAGNVTGFHGDTALDVWLFRHCGEASWFQGVAADKLSQR
jgi:hypothetical protein